MLNYVDLERRVRNFVLDNASELERRSISRAGDRRASPRESVSLPAFLLLAGDELVSCTIVDRSLEGFRIDLGEAVTTVPDRFLMVDLLGGIGHEAQVAWRGGSFVGARSLRRHDLHEPQAGVAAELKKAWARALT